MSDENRYRTTSKDISTSAHRYVAEKGIEVIPSSLSVGKANTTIDRHRKTSPTKYGNFVSRQTNYDDERDRMAANRKMIGDWSTHKTLCGENDFDMKRIPEGTEPDVSSLTLSDSEDVPSTSTENLFKEIAANDKVSARFLANMDKIIGKKNEVKLFFPSCVKLFEMTWLVKRGHTVIAVEKDEATILKLFDMAKVKPTMEYVQSSTMKLYKSTDKRIRIYNTDFCKFSPQCEPDVDVIWDNDAVRSAIRSNKKRFISIINVLMKSGTNYFIAIKESILSTKSQLPRELKIFQEQMDAIQIQMVDTIVEIASEGDSSRGERKTFMYILTKM